MDKKSLNILVTGGTGFIGSHVIEKLLQCGYENISSTYIIQEPKSYFWTNGFEKKVNLVYCDIRDFKKVNQVINDLKVDAVLHLAAQAIVDVAHQNPLETIESNVLGTANVLEVCRQKGDLKAIVVASSDKAYGKSQSLPYKEDHPLKGDHPYDVSKTCTDLLAQTYFKTYKMPITITRFGNVFGPGDCHFDRIIPGIVESIIGNKELKIRSNGKFVREYVFVDDVADAYVTLFEKTMSGTGIHGEAFNFGSDNIMDVLSVVEKSGMVIGQPVKYSVLDNSKNEIPAQFLDWNKTKEVWGGISRHHWMRRLKQLTYGIVKIISFKNEKSFYNWRPWFYWQQFERVGDCKEV